MWGRAGGGGRKSGYGHTAVQEIIIGFVRQHLLCQHSSRQSAAGRATKRLQSSGRFRKTDAETNRNKVRRRTQTWCSGGQTEGHKFKSFVLDQLWPPPPGLTMTSEFTTESWRCFLWGWRNKCLPALSWPEHFYKLSVKRLNVLCNLAGTPPSTDNRGVWGMRKLCCSGRVTLRRCRKQWPHYTNT